MTVERGEVVALKKFLLFAGFIGGILVCIRIAGLGGVWTFAGALGTVAVSMTCAWAANRLFRCEPMRPAMRRYMRRFGISMSGYAVLLIGAMMLYHKGLASGPLGYVIALAPAALILCAIASMGLYLAEEKDEFRREILIQSLLWATAATLSVATVWGFLETFGKAPHAPAWAAVPVFAVVMGLSQPFIARKYR